MKIKILILISLLITATSSSLYSCNCPGIINVQCLKHRVENFSDIVFLGKITAIENDTTKLTVLKVTYEITEILKGDVLSETFKITVTYDMYSSCSVSESWFTKGENRLITARKTNNYIWEANQCDSFINEDVYNQKEFAEYLEEIRMTN